MKILFNKILTTGGFTAKHNGDVAAPTSGFMVGVPPHSHSIPLKGLTAEQVSDGFKVIADKASSDQFIGAWVSKGNVVFDVSELIADLEEAKAIGTKRKEDAIWDNANMKEIKL